MSIFVELNNLLIYLSAPRDRQILVDRILCLERRSTLEEIGKRLNVTGEHIRQLEYKIRLQLSSKKRVISQELVKNINNFTKVAGEAIEMEEALPILASMGLKTSNNARLPVPTLLFLYYAGPYRLCDRLLIHSNSALKRELLAKNLMHSLRKEKHVSLAKADCIANELGINSAKLGHSILNELHNKNSCVYEIRRGIYSYKPTAADRAFSVLEHEARPKDIEYLAARSRISSPALLNALAADSRFIRVKKRHFGLTHWGFEEYEGIIKSIHKGLQYFGGSARLHDVVDWVTGRYGVSRNSVKIYAYSHHDFIITKGILRARQPGRDTPVYWDLKEMGETSCCLLIDGRPTLRLIINEHLLRGSGRPVPRLWALKAGLKPGQKLFLRSGKTGVVLSWHGAAPILTSLRNVISCDSWPDKGLGFLILKDSGFSTLTSPLPPKPSTEPHSIALAMSILFAFSLSSGETPLASRFWEALGGNLGLEATQREPSVILERLAKRRDRLVAPYVESLRRTLLISETNGEKQVET